MIFNTKAISESILTTPTVTTSAVFIRFFFQEKLSNQKGKSNYKDNKSNYFLNHNELF
jgi:hypothetical protein